MKDSFCIIVLAVLTVGIVRGHRLGDLDEPALVGPARQVAEVLLEVGQARGTPLEQRRHHVEVVAQVGDLGGVAAEPAVVDRAGVAPGGEEVRTEGLEDRGVRGGVERLRGAAVEAVEHLAGGGAEFGVGAAHPAPHAVAANRGRGRGRSHGQQRGGGQRGRDGHHGVAAAAENELECRRSS